MELLGEEERYHVAREVLTGGFLAVKIISDPSFNEGYPREMWREDWDSFPCSHPYWHGDEWCGVINSSPDELIISDTVRITVI